MSGMNHRDPQRAVSESRCRSGQLNGRRSKLGPRTVGGGTESALPMWHHSWMHGDNLDRSTSCYTEEDTWVCLFVTVCDKENAASAKVGSGLATVADCIVAHHRGSRGKVSNSPMYAHMHASLDQPSSGWHASTLPATGCMRRALLMIHDPLHATPAPAHHPPPATAATRHRLALLHLSHQLLRALH